MGTTENPKNESRNNFHFFENVHPLFPLERSLLSYSITYGLNPSQCENSERLMFFDVFFKY